MIHTDFQSWVADHLAAVDVSVRLSANTAQVGLLLLNELPNTPAQCSRNYGRFASCRGQKWELEHSLIFSFLPFLFYFLPFSLPFFSLPFLSIPFLFFFIPFFPFRFMSFFFTLLSLPFPFPFPYPLFYFLFPSFLLFSRHLLSLESKTSKIRLEAWGSDVSIPSGALRKIYKSLTYILTCINYCWI